MLLLLLLLLLNARARASALVRRGGIQRTRMGKIR
jgi:hypothetical protein